MSIHKCYSWMDKVFQSGGINESWLSGQWGRKYFQASTGCVCFCGQVWSTLKGTKHSNLLITLFIIYWKMYGTTFIR